MQESPNAGHSHRNCFSGGLLARKLAYGATERAELFSVRHRVVVQLPDGWLCWMKVKSILPDSH
jgi:hypothetical protein